MNTHNKFNNETKITGIIGHPIKHSYSPFMHNIAYELLDLNYLFLPFDVPQSNLKAAIRGMTALGIKGLNVTVPHKENVISLVKNISEEVGIVGAANTIVNDNGTLSAYNTDVYGVMETLLPYKEKIANSEVSIIGCGGASRSVVYALLRNFRPEKINLINRNEVRAEQLKEYFAAKMHFNNFKTYNLYNSPIDNILKDSQLVVNSTSVGMYPNIDDSVVNSFEAFNKDQIVFDMVYNPLNTKLLMLADAAGATTLDGLTMFVHQGAKAFELWTGVEMPVDKIFKALKLHISPVN